MGKGRCDINDFRTFPLIWSWSKYFRCKFHPCLSFHPHPNITDEFNRAEMNILSFVQNKLFLEEITLRSWTFCECFWGIVQCLASKRVFTISQFCTTKFQHHCSQRSIPYNCLRVFARIEGMFDKRPSRITVEFTVAL